MSRALLLFLLLPIGTAVVQKDGVLGYWREPAGP